MGLIKIRILIIFYIYLLSSTSTPQNLGEFPTIRPVPCQNRMKSEFGVCTFNWSCKNVAHGIHIGYCVDRFFVGSCCKIPETGGSGGSGGRPPIISFISTSNSSASTNSSTYSSSNRADQTTKENSQVESLGKVTDASILWTMQERLNSIIPTRVDPFHSINPQNHNDKTSTDAINYTQTLSSISLNRKPVLPNIISTTSSPEGNDFLTNAKTSSGEETLVSSGETPSTVLQLKEEYSTHSYYPRYNSSASEPFHENITAQENKDETTIAQKSNGQGNSINVSESSNVLPSFFNYETQNLRWTNSHQKENNHQISFLIEDHIKQSSELDPHIHKENTSRDSFFTWAYGMLSDGNKNITKIELETSPTEAKLNNSILPSSDTFSPPNPPSHPYTAGSLYEVSIDSNTSDSTVNEIETVPTAADIGPFIENSVNIDKSPLNFTKFMEPHYPWPSPKPTSNEPTSNTSETVILRDVSRVCGRSRSNMMARIVGGRKSHYLRWPWMISLRRFEGKTFKHKCGATLLNQLWAITAAHCVDGKLPNDVILRLGEYNFHRMDESHPHVERRIYMIVIHPEFDPATYENDLALLRFYEPVRFKANIVPVCLPKFTENIEGRTAVVTGWGRLSEEGELPGSLHEVRMPILTNKECEEMYSQAGYSETIRDVFVCAGLTSGGLDACEGDSGGPMVVPGDRGQWMLVGLISWGMGCAAPRQPGVYTRITKFVDWIDEIITY